MFFSYFPKVFTENGLQIVDIFTRISLMFSAKDEAALFEEYIVGDYDRPDSISKMFYGSEKFFWVILAANNAFCERDLLPLNPEELREYCDKKYESLDWALKTPKYYIDARGNIVEPDADESNVVEFVTYFEYEDMINDRKRNIRILKQKYLPQLMKDLRREMARLKKAKMRERE